MECSGCGNPRAYRIRVEEFIDRDGIAHLHGVLKSGNLSFKQRTACEDAILKMSKGRLRQICDRKSCGALGPMAQRDVYFRKAYFDPNLGDPNNVNEQDGAYISSRGEKAARLKKFGLREAGDKIHGARNEDKALERAARKQGHGVDINPNKAK